MKHFIFLILLLLYSCFAFNQTLPSDISGLKLWLSADSVDTINGKVDTWYDKSGNNYNLIQSDSSKSPSIFQNGLNVFPTIAFDGVDDFLRVNFGNSYSTPNTVCIVYKQNTNMYQNVFDGFDSFHALRSRDTIVSLRIGGDVVGFYKKAPFNYVFITCEFNGSSSNLFENSILRSSGYLPNTTLSGFTVGSSYEIAGKYFNGEIAEIIVFDSILTVTERNNVEQYLRYKYAPPVNLGPDITANGFCDTILHAGVRFTNFVWSTGNVADTLEYLTINQTGNYKVTVTDIFGFTSTDSINVTFPNTILNINDTTICLGDTISVNSVISSQLGYSYLWPDLSTNSNVLISAPQSIQVTITDSLGCTSVSNTVQITLDSLKNKINLGNDTSLCSGNNISLLNYPNNPDSLTYLWNDNSTDSLLTINSSGTYSITVTNSRNCVGSDTINVIVSGTAPIVAFNIDTVCFGNVTTITNNSSLTYDSLIWDFGDGIFSNIFNPIHTYSLPGNYFVTLTMYNQGCSNNLLKTAIVKPKPLADFSYTTSCMDFPAEFTNTSILQGSGVISNYYWNFAGLQTSNIENPSYTFTDTGSFFVTFKIITTNGCSDSVTKTLYILNSTPLPNVSLINPIILRKG